MSRVEKVKKVLLNQFANLDFNIETQREGELNALIKDIDIRKREIQASIKQYERAKENEKYAPNPDLEFLARQSISKSFLTFLVNKHFVSFRRFTEQYSSTLKKIINRSILDQEDKNFIFKITFVLICCLFAFINPAKVGMLMAIVFLFYLFPMYRKEYEREVLYEYQKKLENLKNKRLIDNLRYINSLIDELVKENNNWIVREKEVYQELKEINNHRENLSQKLKTEQKYLEERILEYLESDDLVITKYGANKAGITIDTQNSNSLASVHQSNTFFIKKGFIRDTESRLRFIKVLRNAQEENSIQDPYVDESIRIRTKLSTGQSVYGVYEFLVLFWLRGALVTYSGFWDFSRAATLDERVTTYPYDFVVSVETFQKTSTRLRDEEKKRLYQDEIRISFVDGRTLVITDPSVDKQSNIKCGFDHTKNTDLMNAGLQLKHMLRKYRDITKNDKNGI
jgi:hypothetical protein